MNNYKNRPSVQELGGTQYKNRNSNFKRFKEISLPLPKNIFFALPKKMNPVFCTFCKSISEYINQFGICIFLHSQKIDSYDFKIFSNREIWIFHLSDCPSALETRFGYALLRHNASKVQIQCFSLEGAYNAK